MSIIVDDPSPGLAARLRLERETRGWSLGDLAERSGVSKAMISKIERGEASPTAALLGRLSGAFGLTLSVLLARAEARAGRLSRAAEQARWQDPATGYVRREVTPASAAPLELVRVELPARSCVPFPASAFTFIRQVILVLEGKLIFQEGETTHELAPGDCLALGPPSDCTFRNPGARPCEYLVAILRQP
jgi:transcriptional regulator with XRE-family HTH domain